LGVLGTGESHAPYAGGPNPSLATAKPARLSSLVASQKDGLGATLARYGLQRTYNEADRAAGAIEAT